MHLKISHHEKITLAQLLTKLHKKSLRLKEKRILALLLVHAWLQFAESTWLNNDWTKENVIFFRTSEQSAVDIQRPYLFTYFQENAAVKDIDDSGMISMIHPNPSALALGMLLLEIELTRPIDKMRTEDMEFRMLIPIIQPYYVSSRIVIVICMIVIAEQSRHVWNGIQACRTVWMMESFARRYTT
jgi:hypothetical protein